MLGFPMDGHILFSVCLCCTLYLLKKWPKWRVLYSVVYSKSVWNIPHTLLADSQWYKYMYIDVTTLYLYLYEDTIIIIIYVH